LFGQLERSGEIDAIGSEIVIFALFAVGDHGRTSRFETRDRVADRLFIEGIKRRIVAIRFGQRRNQRKRPWDAANGFGGNDHAQFGFGISAPSIGCPPVGASTQMARKSARRERLSFWRPAALSRDRLLLRAHRDAIFRLVCAPK
jgi:hypothetical protein